MAFSSKNLLREEEILLELHPHWSYLFNPALAFFAGLAAGIGMLVWSPEGNVGLVLKWFVGLLLLGGLGWFLVRLAQWRAIDFVVTSDRCIYRHGILTKKGIEIPLERINTVFSSQNLLERMIGAGDLAVESAGETGRSEFTDIRKPAEVQHIIYQAMEDNENRKFDRIGKGQAQALSDEPTLTIPEQIGKLAELHERGVLSDEEFAAKKAQLLERM